jgi:hypothetical protein
VKGKRMIYFNSLNRINLVALLDSFGAEIRIFADALEGNHAKLEVIGPMPEWC